MSRAGAWGPRAAHGQVPSGRTECGAKPVLPAESSGCSWCQPLAVGKGKCQPPAGAPQTKAKGRAGGLMELGKVWHHSGSGCCPPAAARSCAPRLSKALPKRTCSRDGFSCCCTSEWGWIDGMQGADLPGAGASAAVPAVPTQWQGTQPAGTRRKGRRRALQQEPFLSRCSRGEGVLHSRGQAASSWLSVSFHSLLTDKLLRMFLLCPTGPVPLYPHPALSTSCSIHG